MCNFVPGECLAIAQESADSIRALLSDWEFPGSWEILPVFPEGVETGFESAERFREHVFVHMTGISEGLESLAVSKLSAALHDLIGCHRAVVELNLYLPISAQTAGRRQDELSEPARRAASQLRNYLERCAAVAVRRPVALLDSGITFSSLTKRRRLVARDYAGTKQTFGLVLQEDHDLLGHGTNVCRILDAALSDDVPIVSGRIAARSEMGITTLRVATAFAHILASEDPAVVNLSLSPRDDEVICPRCRRAIPVQAFHSLILPYVFRLCADSTLVVMAAGNRGQISNARHSLSEAVNLTLVEASNSTGELARYSNRVDTGHAAVARFFGGDDDKSPAGISVFENARHTFGTSYAAPFVSAAAYAFRDSLSNRARFDSAMAADDFGSFCLQQLQVPMGFHPLLATARGRALATT